MLKVCKTTPSVNINGLELDSILWKEILSYTNNDRTATAVIYALLNSDKIKKLNGVEFNELGQVTLSSVKKVFPIENFLKPKEKLFQKKIQIGALDSKGNVVYYDYVGNIADKVEQFNKDNPDYVATVKTSGRKSTINVEEAGEDVEIVKQDYVFKNKLCKQIQQFLLSQGFTMSFINDNLPYAGMFSPDSILETSEGLRAIIAIAKGERGEKALVEEFGHLLVYGLQHTPIVKRLINNLKNNKEAILTILGDSYENYRTLYTEKNGNVLILNTTKLAYEAAGKLLFEELLKDLEANNSNISKQFYLNTDNKSLEILGNSPIGNFVSRIYNQAKGIFKKMHLTDISSNINEARAYAGYIAAEFLHNQKGLSDNLIEANLESAKTLYDIDQHISRLYSHTQHGIEILKKRLRIQGWETLAEEEAKERWSIIKKALEQLDLNNAIMAICLTLESTYNLIKTLQANLDTLYQDLQRDPNNYTNITSFSVFLNDMQTTIDGFSPYVSACLSIEDLIDDTTINLDSSLIESIKKIASELLGAITSLLNYKDKHSFTNLHNLFSPIFKGTQIDIRSDLNEELGTGKIITLDMILEYAEKDSNFIDRYIRGMSRARDPLLNVANALAESEIAKTNQKLVPLESMIRNMNKELLEAGENNSFIFERNAKGKLTGRLISEYDWDKYYEDLKEYKNSLKASGVKGRALENYIKEWHELRSVTIQKAGRNYVVPNARYKENGVYVYSKPLVFKNAALKKYYEQYMELKALADSELTELDTSYNLYSAVQKRKDSYQRKHDLFRNGDTLEQLKKSFTTEYQTLVDDKEYRQHSGLLDFSGKPVREVPMYYVDLLENPEELLIDSAGALIAYHQMAANYQTMKNLLNNFILLLDYVERKRKTKRTVKLKNENGEEEELEIYEVTANTNTTAILDNFIQTVMLGNKKDIETFTIGGWTINMGKIADKILRYNSAAKIAMNTRVDIANRFVGVMNLWFEASSGEYFNGTQFRQGGLEYYKLLPGYTANAWSATKDDFLSLLIKKYDIMEDYEELLNRGGIRYNWVARAAGMSAYLGQRIGELGNHVPSGIAVLLNTKVKDENGNITDLYHTLEKVEFETKIGGHTTKFYDVLPRKGVTDLDGNPLRLEDGRESNFLTGINTLATNIIHSVNQTINGSFRDINASGINRKWMGRAALQFRKWMVDYFDSRWGGGYYDARTGKWRESTYGRGLKLAFLNLLLSWRKFEFLEVFKMSKLNDRERALVKKFYAEGAAFLLTSFLIKILASAFTEKDDKGKRRWKNRLGFNVFESPEMLAYALCRMALLLALISHRDLSAEFPSPGIFDNINSIFLNIFPSLQAFADFLNLFNPFIIGNHKDHKGLPLDFLMIDDAYFWNWEKILIPYIETLNKTFRIIEGDTMKDFLPYIINDEDLDWY